MHYHFLEDPWFLSIGALLIAYCANRLIGLRERSLVLTAKSKKGDAREAASDVQELRAELMRLRDTSTQYDLSVERALTEIARRLAALERPAGLPMPGSIALPTRETKGKKNATSVTTNAGPEEPLRLGHK